MDNIKINYKKKFKKYTKLKKKSKFQKTMRIALFFDSYPIASYA